MPECKENEGKKNEYFIKGKPDLLLIFQTLNHIKPRILNQI